MDLSDISNFEDIMITSSDEDIPAFEDSPYWKNSGLHWTLDIDYKLFNLYLLFDKLLSLEIYMYSNIFNHLTCMILTWRSTEIENFITEQGAFPLVIVWDAAMGSLETCTYVILMPESPKILVIVLYWYVHHFIII